MATSVQGGVTTAYTYNHADRLASFTRGGNQIGAYTYNARGQLVIRTVTNTLSNGVTVYFYDQEGHVIAEYDGVSGLLKREYIWLGDRPLAVIDAGTPSVTYYVHADHLDRPIAMTNASKAFVARYTWSAYGELHAYTGTKGIDLRFPGQLFQAESGLHYNWFRQYDPTIGRYTQPDPLGLIDGPSRYAYVGNDPLQAVDPEGRWGFLVAGAISGLIGAATDLGWQLASHGGNWNCIDYWSVGRAFALDGVVGMLGPAGPIFGKAGSTFLGSVSKRGILNNSEKFRVGWSWNDLKGHYEFAARTGKGRATRHSLPLLAVPEMFDNPLAWGLLSGTAFVFPHQTMERALAGAACGC